MATINGKPCNCSPVMSNNGISVSAKLQIKKKIRFGMIRLNANQAALIGNNYVYLFRLHCQKVSE